MNYKFNSNNIVKFNTLENFKVNRFDLDLKNNLYRQKEILKRAEEQQFYDITKEPKKLLDFLGVKLNDEKDDIINNQILYKMKKNIKNDNLNIDNESDFDIFKKKNLVTEYAYFMRAKDNYNFNQIRAKYNI